MKKINYNHPLIQIGLIICLFSVLMVIVSAANGISTFLFNILAKIGFTFSERIHDCFVGILTYLLVVGIYNLYYRYKEYRDEIDADLVKEIKDLESRLHSAELQAEILMARYEPESSSKSLSSDCHKSYTPDTNSQSSISQQNQQQKVGSYTTHTQHNLFLSWFPAVCILLLFVCLCVYSFYANSLSLDVSDNIPVVDDRVVSSSVDFKTSYVGSINSDFIHRDTCRHAENIQKKNRVYYESVSDALADGRVKCSECFP